MKSKFHDVLKIKNKNFPENFVYQISKIIGASFSNLLDLLILNLSLPSIASSYIYLPFWKKYLDRSFPSISHTFTNKRLNVPLNSNVFPTVFSLRFNFSACTMSAWTWHGWNFVTFLFLPPSPKRRWIFPPILPLPPPLPFVGQPWKSSNTSPVSMYVRACIDLAHVIAGVVDLLQTEGGNFSPLCIHPYLWNSLAFFFLPHQNDPCQFNLSLIVLKFGCDILVDNCFDL